MVLVSTIVMTLKLKLKCIQCAKGCYILLYVDPLLTVACRKKLLFEHNIDKYLHVHSCQSVSRSVSL